MKYAPVFFVQIFLNFFNFFNNVALGNGLPLDGGTLYLQSIRILTNAKKKEHLLNGK